MINLNSAENAQFMLWPKQFQKIRQIKAWYHRINLTNPLKSYKMVWDQFWDCHLLNIQVKSVFNQLAFEMSNTPKFSLSDVHGISYSGQKY